jgi:Arylsulfotransferase (ASST)
MNRRRPAGASCAAMALAIGLCACGGAASTASPGTITPAAEISAAASNPVTISPLPGTEDASPETQISFLGGPGTQVSEVRVLGSTSGAHSGRIEGYSTGTGASFLPSRPFRTGERVTVHAMVSTGAGADPQPASTTFTIAHQASVSQKEFPNNPGDQRAIQHYISAPTLTPSTVKITTAAKPGASPGDLFLAPYQGAGSPGPMISEQNGSLVWSHPLPAGEDSTNFQVQQYEGKPVLTWWQGRILEAGFGQGEDVIYDTSYRPLAYIRAGNGYHADLHEIRLTPQGTAWIDAFDPIHMNLSSAHGSSEGVVNDSVIEEIDIKTGLVMWEWHAIGHIALSESHSPAPHSSSPWDYVHINSVDPGTAGDVLLSSRGTWTLYDVNMHTGGFDWRLGSRDSSFKLGPGTRFYWQHDAEWQPGGLISVFDNGSDPPEEKQSRGLLLAPDTSDHTVSLLKQFVNPTHTLLASSQGNTLNLSPGVTTGNWLMGYGGLPNFTEYDSSGHVLLDGTLGKNVQSFRTYLSAWSAHPTSTPSLAIQSHSAGAVTVATSWNGATEVASWQVLAGASPTSLTLAANAPRNGFQTSIALTSAPAYLAVQALNASGAVIGRSPTIRA